MSKDPHTYHVTPTPHFPCRRKHPLIVSIIVRIYVRRSRLFIWIWWDECWSADESLYNLESISLRKVIIDCVKWFTGPADFDLKLLSLWTLVFNFNANLIIENILIVLISSYFRILCILTYFRLYTYIYINKKLSNQVFLMFWKLVK